MKQLNFNMEIIKEFCEEFLIDINEVQIICSELPSFTRGLFREGVVYFSNNPLNFIKSSVEETILHELTHYIQWREKRLFLPGDRLKRICSKILFRTRFKKYGFRLYYSIKSEKEAIKTSRDFIKRIPKEDLTTLQMF